VNRHVILLKVQVRIHVYGFVQPMVSLLKARETMFHNAVQVSNRNMVTAVGSGTEEEIAKLVHDLHDLYDFTVYDTCKVSIYL
jgi:hypothetical protein